MRLDPDVKQAAYNSFCSKPVLILSMLWLCMILSALGVVVVKTVHRNSFIYLQQLEDVQDELHTEWTQLLLESSTWASHSRIEHIATTKLDMAQPTADDIDIFQIPDTDT